MRRHGLSTAAVRADSALVLFVGVQVCNGTQPLSSLVGQPHPSAGLPPSVVEDLPLQPFCWSSPVEQQDPGLPLLRRSDRDRHPAVDNGVVTDVRDVDFRTFRYVITAAGINEVAVWSVGCQPHPRSSCREAIARADPATASKAEKNHATTFRIRYCLAFWRGKRQRFCLYVPRPRSIPPMVGGREIISDASGSWLSP
jgi:hypothetical protein